MDGIADYAFIRPLGQGNQGRYFPARTPERLPVQDESVAVEVLEGDPLPAMRRVVSTAPELAPSLSAAEAALVSRCLAADRADRPATARQPAEAIDQLNAEVPAG